MMVDRRLELGAVDALAGVSFPTALTVERSTSVLGVAAGCFFSIRTILVLISARWFEAGTEPGVVATFAISLVLLIAASLQAFGNGARPVRWIWGVGAFRWVAVYLAYSGLSLLWSAAVSPLGSALYWCALVSDVAVVILVCRGAGPATGAHSIMKGFITGSCFLAAIAWLMPAAEDLRLGDMNYFNTNQIGNLCALSVLAACTLETRKDGRWRIPIMFLTLTLFRSLSKATLVAFLASQGYRLLRDRGVSGRKKLILVFSTVVVVGSFWGLFEAYYGVYTTAGNQAETLTGRTAVWAWALDEALNKPLIGNGVDAMWKVAPPFGGNDMFEARHAENELLQQFFAYGVIGIAMLAGIYGSLWRRFRRVNDRSERTALIALVVFVLIRGLAEAEPFDLLLPLWMITALTLFQSGTERCIVENKAPQPMSRAVVNCAG
jgi:exopolysaccharide production protein ExoQ